MKWKDIITDYFTFSRRERIGIIITLMVIIILAFLPSFFSSNGATKTEIPDTSWIAAMKKLEQNDTLSEPVNDNGAEIYAYQYDPSKPNKDNKPTGDLFYFDPNTLSKDGWQKLGIRDKTIKTIENYISKGGHFRKPDDLPRVYGLRKNEYERLAPFVKIQPGLTDHKEKNFASKNTLAENQFPLKSYSPVVVDVNSADTSAFIALPGIGSKLAARIINFRDKLGGFYSIDQVRETFGLPDSTFQKIKQNLALTTTSIKKININTATTDELKTHPYIKWNIASTLIAYRNEHGAFSSIGDIKKIMTITDEVYKKIAPYLSIQ